MGQIAERLLDLMMQLPEAERRDFVRLVLSARNGVHSHRETRPKRTNCPASREAGGSPEPWGETRSTRMKPNMHCVVDTNVLVYAAVENSPLLSSRR